MKLVKAVNQSSSSREDFKFMEIKVKTTNSSESAGTL